MDLKLVNQLKRLNEGDLFPSPSEGELADRTRLKKEEWLKYAESVVPGITQKLTTILKDPILVETAIAYADTQFVVKVIKLPPPKEKWSRVPAELYDARNLDWHGPWVDGKTLLKQSKLIGQYNNFTSIQVGKLVRKFPNRKFQMARESSPAIYVRPVTELEFKNNFDLGLQVNSFLENEHSLEGNTLRLWWD